MNLKPLLVIALLAACAGCNRNSADSSAQAKADIKALEDNLMAAAKNKDINAVMAFYVPDQTFVAFDVVTPLQFSGADAYRKDWQDFFAQYPGPLDGVIADLDIAVGGDIAYSHSIQRMSLTGKDGKKTRLTLRVTDGYKKIDGHWLIAHEHNSIPVDPATMKGDFDAK